MNVNALRVRRRKTFWQKIGGGSLTFSIAFHAILLVIAVFWIFAVVKEPEKKVDFMPKAGGGGSPETQAQAKEYRLQSISPQISRVVALGSTSNLVLPEQDEMPQLASLSSMASGGMSGGLGGSGRGGGKGNGDGKGVGDGGGLGTGGGGFKNPFGVMTSDKNALVGNFYDLKQTSDGKPTGFSEAETLKVIQDFVTKDNWDTRQLAKFYKAPHTLYQTKLYMPIMSASLAPEAFGASGVQPVFWVAHYRGMVAAPRSGRIRFVGRADNVMVVRFNGKIVLDGGDYSAVMAKSIWDPGNISILAGKSGNKDQEKEARRGGYDVPVKSYHYATTGQYNERGGVMVGKAVDVRGGSKYPVEILLSELGGLFGASLMFEEEGVEYSKTPAGVPILPLFRVSPDLPAASTEGRGSPPFDPNGAIWKVIPGIFTGGI